MSETWFQKDEKYFFHTYHRLPVEIERAEGVYIYTKDGKRCTDFFGGLAVNALGHCHPRIIAAVEKQIHRYMHVSNYFLQEPQVELAERLVKLTGYEKVFFSNSGTEAVEGAIKLSRKWGKKNGKTRLISMTNSFHGRTMGALSLTERPKYRDGYEPFLPDTDSVEFNNVKDLIRKTGTTTLAVILEFIQGEGGVNVVSPEFVKSLTALQKQFGFLIIADEIQAGSWGEPENFLHFRISMCTPISSFWPKPSAAACLWVQSSETAAWPISLQAVRTARRSAAILSPVRQDALLWMRSLKKSS